MKRIFIIHGWGGNPKDGWFPWLKKELENKGYKVEVLSMPNSDEPKIKEWVSFLNKKVGKLDENTYFVGHSIGCQTIMRYLENSNIKIKGIIFVAAWFNLKNLETKEDEEIAEPWIKTKIDLKKVKDNCKKVITIFSDNDPFVPLSDSKIFKKELNAKIIIEKNKGHFSGSDNIRKLPVVLNELLKLTK